MPDRAALRVLLCLGLVSSLLLVAPLGAQTAPRVGIEERALGDHALTHATVIVAPGTTMTDATIVIRDGVIVAVGRNIQIPAKARVWDLTGHTVTAGWIDLDLRTKISLPDGEASREGRAWNEKVHPEIDTAEGFRLDEGTARSHREAGFALALAAPDSGVLAGQAALVRLTGRDDRRTTVESGLAMVAALDHGGWGDGGYPGSRMGAIALLRQTLFDARWYGEAWSAHLANPGPIPRPEVNRALAALGPVLEQKMPVALRSRDALDLLSIAAVAREFELRGFIYGNGQEQLWLDAVRELGMPIVLPVTFPETPTVDGPGGDTDVTLRQLELWARAPENAGRLARAGVSFAMTPRGLDKTTEFSARVREAIERGLSTDAALAAVTTEPAALLGLENRFGAVREGLTATLTVLDGRPFEKDTKITEVWIDGERFPVDAYIEPDLRGTWELTLHSDAEASPLVLEIEGDLDKPKLSAKQADEDVKPAALHRQGNEVGFTFAGSVLGDEGYVRLGAAYGGGESFEGTARTPRGETIRFTAHRTAAHAEEPDEDDPYEFENNPWAGSIDEQLPTPLGARGRTEPAPGAGSLLVRGATIWTSGPAGILENADIHIRDGKVVEVGRDLVVDAGTPILLADGRHITPGIIDPHSHTAITGGVNEGTQYVTAEVRIGDVVQPDDINIYRQLAGGVTCAQLLHGSANPIGGQSAVIKYKWGQSPAELKIDEPKLIKCALGENVKQSNWSNPSRRYPQTRMGVEQVFRDAFWAARQYQSEWDAWKNRDGMPGAPPRTDLELEALAEILRGERLIHCHSYRQDEILMLMRVAEDFGFRIGTFQHVLEGFKIAEEIAAHGAAASSFSDWWAYKFEVYDAIPYNGALLHRAGVVTSFNSDSDELARRLNIEAAKAVKYGGVTPAEALKFVTLNPAKQLAIADRTGSLEPGKDADFVIWSGDPLSTYTICEETWIEGRRYFSREEDASLRARDTARREALITRILKEKHGVKNDRKKDSEVEVEGAEPQPRVQPKEGGSR